MMLYDDGNCVYQGKPEDVIRWAKADAEGRRKLEEEKREAEKKKKPRSFFKRLFC